MVSLGYEKRTKVAIPGDDITSSPGLCVYMADSWWPVVVGLLEGGLNESFWDESTGEVAKGTDGILSFATQETEDNCMIHGILCYHTASGVHGGSAAVGWNARPVNRWGGDFDASVVVSGTQVQIPPGRWKLIASSSGNRVNGHKISWNNNNTGLDEINGVNAYARNNAAFPGSSVAMLEGEFITNGTDLYQLRHWCDVARATFGLGAAVGAPGENVYMQMSFLRLGDG